MVIYNEDYFLTKENFNLFKGMDKDSVEKSSKKDCFECRMVGGIGCIASGCYVLFAAKRNVKFYYKIPVYLFATCKFVYM